MVPRRPREDGHERKAADTHASRAEFVECGTGDRTQDDADRRGGGSMTMPVTVADWPSTFWMKIGNVTLVAATAALIRVTRIAELRKLRVARVSTRNNGSSSLTCLYTNATKATRPTTIEVMTTGLVHPIVEADEKP